MAVGRFLSRSPVDVVAPGTPPAPCRRRGRRVVVVVGRATGPGRSPGRYFATMLGELDAALASKMTPILPPLVRPLDGHIATALDAPTNRACTGRPSSRAPGPGLAVPPVAAGTPTGGNVPIGPPPVRGGTDSEVRRAGPGRVGPRLDDGDRRGTLAYPGHVDRRGWRSAVTCGACRSSPACWWGTSTRRRCTTSSSPGCSGGCSRGLTDPGGSRGRAGAGGAWRRSSPRRHGPSSRSGPHRPAAS